MANLTLTFGGLRRPAAPGRQRRCQIEGGLGYGGILGVRWQQHVCERNGTENTKIQYGSARMTYESMQWA